jgi:transposase
LSEAQGGAIEPLLAKNQPGARRTDDRRVISGIVPVLKTGCRGPDCPSVDAPPTTIDNRFRRWTMRGLWRRRLEALARPQPGDGQALDSTTAKAQPFGGGRKRGAEAQALGRSRGGRTTKIHGIADARGRPIAIDVTPGPLGDVRVATALIRAVPPGGSLAADAAYDRDGLRRFLKERGTIPIIPNNPTRKNHHPFDHVADRQRNRIERMFRRLKDWRRIATRYDTRAANFAAAIMLAAVVIWWT